MASKEDKKKAREYMGRSLPRTLLAIGRDWGAIIGLTCLGVWLDNWWFYVPIAWAIGAFQFAISESLLHEASHFNLAKSHKVNDALEVFYGLPFLQTVQHFREEHLAHHTKFGKPEDHQVEDYELWGFHKPGRNMFWLIIVKPVLGWAAWFYVSWLSLKPWKQGLKLISFWVVTISAFWYYGRLDVLAFY
jgi:fatty acid desaturase